MAVIPVQHLADSKTGLLAYRFQDQVEPFEVVEAIIGLARKAEPGPHHKSLLVFNAQTDLSEIRAADLRTIKSAMKAVYSESGINLGTGAIVVDGSLDAKIIMPLWKAICEVDDDLSIRYRFFIDLDPALAWLDVLETPALHDFLASERSLQERRAN